MWYRSSDTIHFSIDSSGRGILKYFHPFFTTRNLMEEASPEIIETTETRAEKNARKKAEKKAQQERDINEALDWKNTLGVPDHLGGRGGAGVVPGRRQAVHRGAIRLGRRPGQDAGAHEFAVPRQVSRGAAGRRGLCLCGEVTAQFRLSRRLLTERSRQRNAARRSAWFVQFSSNKAAPANVSIPDNSGLSQRRLRPPSASWRCGKPTEPRQPVAGV